ncbi:MAG TPA: serine/threonine-protein kinase [Rubrivivax sp.]|nr:serine/threonine-protein kinase [Rubrivivax sp.]
MSGAIGPYRLLRVLGRGSMGVVHLAVDSRTQQPLALKLLSLGQGLSADEYAQARERFLAEADTARRLSHADIVSVHGAGEQDGRAWLAMELLSGCELGRYTHMSRLLPEPLVLRLVERLARALAHAHAMGVVHRDIKPANVMLDLPAGRLKLTDFGVAGLADPSRTRTGVVLGTPYYMAPEQLAGAAADARSDLYALGVLLFQLLSGRLPHEHASLGELLRAVATEPAPDVRMLRPGVAPALAEVVAWALQKRPGQRPASALDLAGALAALAPAHGLAAAAGGA